VIRLERKFNDDGTEDYSSDHPNAVKLLLDFIYLGDYMPSGPQIDVAQAVAIKASPQRKKKSHHQQAASTAGDKLADDNAEVDEPGPLEMHTRIYSLASKYDLPKLRTTAVTKYNEVVQSRSFSSEDLATAITIAYNTGSKRESEMRKAVLASVVKNLKLTATEGCIRNAITCEKDLAVDIMAAVAGHCSCHSSYRPSDATSPSRVCRYCRQRLSGNSPFCQSCVSYS
jgi:hypothetical protein